MKGERKSKRRGSSVEFAEHRNYTFGDDLRHIDWNVYGRLDKLFLKLFLEEEDLHVYTLLDTSLSMDFGTPTKLRYGKQVAAALAFIGLVNHDRVLLDTFSARLDQGLHGIRGRSQMWRVVQYLDQLEATGSEQPDRRGPRVRDPARRQGGRRRHLRLPRQARLPGRPPLPAGAEHGHLRHPRPQPGGSRARARRRPPPGRLPRTTTIAEITISAPLLKRYKDNLNAFVGGLKEWCTQRGITYIFTTNQLSVRQADPQLSARARAGEMSCRGDLFRATLT